MRGEHDVCLAPLLADIGSPPHARGTLTSHSLQVLVYQDHPRMRGEHLQL